MKDERFDALEQRVAKVLKETGCDTTKEILGRLFPDLPTVQEHQLKEAVHKWPARYIRIVNNDVLVLHPEVAEAIGADFWTVENKIIDADPTWKGWHCDFESMIRHLNKIDAWIRS